MTGKLCAGRRPDGSECFNNVPDGNRAFCERCSGEVFKTKAKFDSAPDGDKPNAYEAEPVEVPFNEPEENDEI